MNKIITYIISILFLISCSSNKNIHETKSLNKKLKKQYKTSIKSFYGKLDNKELEMFYKLLIKNTDKKIDTTKTILINFIQKTEYCEMDNISSEYKAIVLNNVKNISNRITTNYSAENLLIYTNNSYAKEFIVNDSDWLLDRGFFKASIFTSDVHCGAYFIIKPNGQFYKYYGGDYFSDVENLLSLNKWNFKK